MDTAVGNNVKALREKRAWSQEHLAAVAGTSARTVQRIERGEPASVDTLMALAQALDVTIDVLRITPEAWNKAVEDLKQLEERYRIVNLQRIERASMLSQLFSGADAMLCEHVDLANDAEEDEVARFEGVLRDCLDVWSDISPTSRREAEKDLQTIIEDLNALGLVVAAGSDSRRLRFMNGTGHPVAINTLYLMISRAKDPKLFIALDKRAPVQFTA